MQLRTQLIRRLERVVRESPASSPAEDTDYADASYFLRLAELAGVRQWDGRGRIRALTRPAPPRRYFARTCAATMAGKGTLEEELKRMEAVKRATSDLERVAARLAESQDQEMLEEAERGMELGREWARDVATLRELRGIAENEHGLWIRLELPADHSLAGFLEEDEVGWQPGSDDVVRIEREPFIEGFVQGADEVLKAVDPLL